MPTGGSRFSTLWRQLLGMNEQRIRPARTGTDPAMRRELALIIAFTLFVMIAGLSYVFFGLDMDM